MRSTRGKKCTLELGGLTVAVIDYKTSAGFFFFFKLPACDFRERALIYTETLFLDDTQVGSALGGTCSRNRRRISSGTLCPLTATGTREGMGICASLKSQIQKPHHVYTSIHQASHTDLRGRAERSHRAHTGGPCSGIRNLGLPKL